MGLIELPKELMLAIVEVVDNSDDLRNLRQTCREMSLACTPTLFRTISIQPDRTLDDSDLGKHTPEAWWEIANHDDLRFHVRYVVVEFVSWIDEPSIFLDYFRLRFPTAAKNVKGHFPNARSLNLRLPRTLRGSRLVRKQFYDAVLELGAYSPESVTISHLDLLAETYDARSMLDVRRFEGEGEGVAGRLPRRLHLCFERCSLEPLRVPHDHSLRHLDRHYKSMQRKLKRYWLRPNLHLTHLSLYCGTYWGAFPLIDFTNLRLPQLKTLALGNYCFAVPSQMWSLIALEQLESLLLDDCPILFLTILTKYAIERLSIDSSSWEELETVPGGEGSNELCVYKTKTSWEVYFDRLRLGLPRLRQFGFRPGDWSWATGRPRSVELHNEFSIDWHPQSRYVAYDAPWDDWLEVDSKPRDVEDKFFRVDLDKKLNYRFRLNFERRIAGEVPQVLPDRIKKDLAGLQRLIDVVQVRAKDYETELNSK